VHLVCFQDILVSFGSGQYDDRDARKRFVGFDLCEYLATAHLWQVKVEQDQIWARSLPVFDIVQEGKCGFSVICDVHVVEHFAGLESALGQKDIALIVLHQQISM